MNLSWRSGRNYDVVRAARDAFIAGEIVRVKEGSHAVELDGFTSYLVTPDGEVYSTLGRKLTKLRPGTKPGGYKFVGLTNAVGERKYEMVHRLVAKAFIPNPMGLPAVNHRDLDKTNNHTSNLEWVTYKENSIHAVESGATTVGMGIRSLTPDEVTEVLASKDTYREISIRFGCSAQTVCNVKRGHGAYRRIRGAARKPILKGTK